MKNKIRFKVVVYLFLFGSISSYAQKDLTLSFGATLYLSNNATNYGLMFSPSLHFAELGDNASVSLTTYPAFGASFSSGNGSSSSAFIYDVPLVAELNLGLGAPTSDAGFGFFLGGGYGVSNISTTFFGDNFAHGPMGNTGIRYRIQDRRTSLRFSYLHSINDGGENVYGLGFLIMFKETQVGGGKNAHSDRGNSRETNSRTRR